MWLKTLALHLRAAGIQLAPGAVRHAARASVVTITKAGSPV
jgi:hypothetical protein